MRRGRKVGETMGSTKFINQIADEELTRALFGAVSCEGDHLVSVELERSRNEYSPFNVTFTYETILDGEDETSILEDTYEVDDYNVTPFDWGGDTTGLNVTWRKWLFGKFGNEYAIWHLFGMMEDSISQDDATKWLIDP